MFIAARSSALTASAVRSNVGRKGTSILGRSTGVQRAFSTVQADGIPVAASAGEGAKTAAITVAIKAGPRFESTPGVAHVLKNFTFKANARRSALAIVREAELNGGILSSALSKEHLLLTAEFLRGDEDFFVQILGDVLASSKLASHEFKEEVLPAVQSEYEAVLNQPNVLGYDVLTQTAYRQRGLGASLFASPSSPVSHSQSVAFARSVFAKNNIAVVGSGIDSAALQKLVSAHFKDVAPSKGNVEAGSKQYFGGDARVAYTPHHGDDSPRAHFGHYFLAFEGGAVDASPELAILRSHLGGESSVKWSSGLSPLSKVAESVEGSTVNAFNINFTDSGLFGVYVTAPHAQLQQVVKSAAQAIKDTTKSLSKEDLEKAKAKAKFELASALETRASVHAAVAGQLLEGKKVQLLEETFSKIDGVSASSLASAAEKALKTKATTVAVGDVHKLPYADEVL